MKLMKLSEYRALRYTPNSMPTLKTLRKLVETGVLPGKRQGATYYVDVDAEQKLTGNPLVDRVLQQG